MDDNNERRDLYEQFESEVVKRGNTEAFFDEEELVEIFDYASDYDNFIVKMEVLLYGAVHYPASEALATRRAWLYYSFGDVEATAELNKRVSNGGTLNRLLDLRAKTAGKMLPQWDLEAALDQILNDTDDFGDEEIIQFTDYAMDMGLSSWLKAKKDKILSRCSFPQTFLYEFAVRAEEAEDYPTAIALFEELTMLEPFTLDFWLCLASAQLSNDNFEDALSSADYALAIDAESMKAMRIKGTSLYRLDRDKQEVVDLYTTIVTSEECVESDVAALGATLSEVDRITDAKDLLSGYLLVNPEARSVINVLLYLDKEMGAPYLRSLIKSDRISEAEIVEWAKVHVYNGNFELGANIFLLYDEIRGIKENLTALFDVLYLAGDYEKIIELYRGKDLSAVRPVDPSITSAYIMSFVRSDKREEALKEAQKALAALESYRSTYSNGELASLLQQSPVTAGAILTGYRVMIENIIRGLQAHDTLPADDFDPRAM